MKMALVHKFNPRLIVILSLTLLLQFYGAWGYTEAVIEDARQVITGCSVHIHLYGDNLDQFIRPDGGFNWKSCREVCVETCSSSDIAFTDPETDQCAYIAKRAGDPAEDWETPDPETLPVPGLDDDDDDDELHVVMHMTAQTDAQQFAKVYFCGCDCTFRLV